MKKIAPNQKIAPKVYKIFRNKNNQVGKGPYTWKLQDIAERTYRRHK